MKYRKKSSATIEAEQIDINLSPSYDGKWLVKNNPFGAIVMRRPKWYSFNRVPMILTLGGWVSVRPFDWIIRGIEGDLRACGPNVFAAAYEPVDDTTKETSHGDDK